MVHHAPGPAYARTGRRTWLVLAAVPTLLALLAAGVGVAGGFADASAEVPTGRAAENDLFRFVPTKAQLHAEEAVETRYQIRVTGELTSKRDQPEPAGAVLAATRVGLLPGGPGGEESGAELYLRRGGDGRPYPWIQPKTSRTVTMLWELPRSFDSPDRVDRVRVRVLKTEYGLGFLDQDQSWQADERRPTGDVVIPLAGG